MTANNQTVCPSEDSLTKFVLGKLTPSETTSLEQHLSDCEPCNDTIRMLDVNDTFLDLARVGIGSLSADPTQLSDNEAQLVNQLMADLRDPEHLKNKVDATRSLESRAAEVIRLLEPAEIGGDIGRLGDYRVRELIGAGATGVVFRALDAQLDREVALKVLRPSLGEDARQRFLSEAKAMAALDHENIVTIYQVGSTEPLAFMAMQWLPGETLEQILERKGRLGNERAVQLGQQIAAGLSAAHDKGMIHRDIKPANIWVESERERVKILDFGLARVMDDAPGITETGLVAGTPNYMSPEQSRGEPLDARTDLFSLGCVLFRASTGKQPFESANVLGTLQAIQKVDLNLLKNGLVSYF